MPPLLHRRVLSTRIDATSYADATARIIAWAQERSPRYVCVTSAHGVVEAHERPSLQPVWNESDLNTPDGMPIVWALRAFGIPEATRVYGPTLTLRICEAAAQAGVPLGLYGGTPESLKAFSESLRSRFPEVEIACSIAPPFRPLTDEEDEAYVQEIAASGARILLVGIGCPKQELWMHAHRDRVQAVMVGVGAAFDFHAGRVRQAPTWMQQSGLEWLFRLMMEPKRLWKRYSRIVPRFMLAFGKQWAQYRPEERPPARRTDPASRPDEVPEMA